MIDPILQAPNLTLAADYTATMSYKRDPRNYVTQLFAAQLPAIRTGFFNVHMSRGIVVQPHWHPNSTELVILLSGEATTAVFDPFARTVRSYRLRAGQASVFPRGWFHWIIALTDHVHLLTVFDAPTPDTVLGSDFLTAIPPAVMNRAYCLDEATYARAVAPITPLTKNDFLGPPPGCQR